MVGDACDARHRQILFATLSRSSKERLIAVAMLRSTPCRSALAGRHYPAGGLRAPRNRDSLIRLGNIDGPRGGTFTHEGQRRALPHHPRHSSFGRQASRRQACDHSNPYRLVRSRSDARRCVGSDGRKRQSRSSTSLRFDRGKPDQPPANSWSKRLIPVARPGHSLHLRGSPLFITTAWALTIRNGYC
jgi:hypothetical protein